VWFGSSPSCEKEPLRRFLCFRKVDASDEQLCSIRLYLQYFPAYRALNHSQCLLRMQSVVNDGLEARIAALEEVMRQVNLLPPLSDNQPWVTEEPRHTLPDS
jgi:hypothetical protein